MVGLMQYRKDQIQFILDRAANAPVAYYEAIANECNKHPMFANRPMRSAGVRYVKSSWGLSPEYGAPCLAAKQKKTQQQEERKKQQRQRQRQRQRQEAGGPQNAPPPQLPPPTTVVTHPVPLADVVKDPVPPAQVVPGPVSLVPVVLGPAPPLLALMDLQARLFPPAPEAAGHGPVLTQPLPEDDPLVQGDFPATMGNSPEPFGDLGIPGDFEVSAKELRIVERFLENYPELLDNFPELQE